MKYRLRYGYTTTNYHVYYVESRSKGKHGRKVYLPRYNDSEQPLRVTDIIMHEDALISTENRARIVYKPEDEPK